MRGTRQPAISRNPQAGTNELSDRTGLSLERILAVLDRLVDGGEALSPLGTSRLRAGIAKALGGDDGPVRLEPGLRDATSALRQGASPADVRWIRDSLAAVLCLSGAGR